MNDEQTILLRNIFLDISRGYSVGLLNKQKVKIKHLGLEDQAMIDSFRSDYYQRAIKLGLPTETQRLEALESKGFWTKSDENKIKAAEDFITRLNQTLARSNHFAQKEALDKTIAEEEQKLNKLRETKANYVGKTAETYADKKLNEYFLYYSIRNYKNLDQTLFSEEEFDELEDTDVNELAECYNKAVGRIDSMAVKRIALQPFFQTYFFLTDSVAEFWGTKILSLTVFQTDLSYWARYFKKVIQNSDNPIPQEILNDPEELLKFMNLNSEARKTLSNTKGELGASSNPNMTREDYQKLGIKPENPESVWVRKKFEETGIKSLTGREMAELRQNGSIKKWDT